VAGSGDPRRPTLGKGRRRTSVRRLTEGDPERPAAPLVSREKTRAKNGGNGFL